MEIALIYPHQLFAPGQHPALTPGRAVYLVEEPLLFTHNPAHRQRLMLHKLSMDAYESELRVAGHHVTRLPLASLTDSSIVFDVLANANVQTCHIVDTTDDYLERAINLAATQHGLTFKRYDSPLFLLPKAEAMNRYQKSGRQMARFYKSLRLDRGILIDDDGAPRGGRWSFDDENRRSLPKRHPLPEDLTPYTDAAIDAAKQWIDKVSGELYGEALIWLPYTRAGAQKFLDDFLCSRLAEFGPYEDAITSRHHRLFHSTVSPLLNIGLLLPSEVLAAALNYAQSHEVPLNSLEGFVRQLLGWREFIRGAYEVDGRSMRTKNFFNHSEPLPQSMWDGSTDILPVDRAITTALHFGYTHHIERLMVLGNFLLLIRTHPDEVYRWFMAMYVDAYDWVMVPNVYGMSQFADGGSFATKPYISGGNYLMKMSDYPKGDWERTFTALYWAFIRDHQTVFASNHRLAMMPRLLAKMSDETRERHFATADEFLETVHRQ